MHLHWSLRWHPHAKAASSLDEDTEAGMMSALKASATKMRRGRAVQTIIAIAHRLQSIIHSDKVAVMSKGELVEFGPPSVLLKASCVFASLAEVCPRTDRNNARRSTVAQRMRLSRVSSQAHGIHRVKGSSWSGKDSSPRPSQALAPAPPAGSVSDCDVPTPATK